MKKRVFPDTGIARAAETFLAEVSNQSMLNHCLRTYRFADAIGEMLRLKPDKEVLYVASLLHDLGLEAPYEQQGDFEVVGGKAAEAFMLKQGAKESTAALVRTAIEVHTQFSAAKDDRPEVKLLHFGSYVDAFGVRLDELPPKLVEEILKDHPRLDWKNMIVKIMERRIAANPSCQMAENNRKYKTIDYIRNAPFAE